MSLKCLSLAFKFILITSKAAIYCLEMFDFSLESRYFIISQFLGDPAIVLEVSKFLTSKELLVIHLGKSTLGLHVLMVDLLIVLNLSI
jgi:hypothetical protein